MKIPVFKTKAEAVKDLAEFGTHDFIIPEYVNALVKPFGVESPNRTYTDTRSQFKGLTLKGNKEGDTALGLGSMELARFLCKVEGIEYIFQNGRGSQFNICIARLKEHFK